jgi:hypothetical protein
VKGKHKLGRLHLKTTMRILANPHLPLKVRAAVEAYAATAHPHATPADAALCRSVGAEQSKAS